MTGNIKSENTSSLGFTLIELMLYMVLSMVIMAVLAAFFSMAMAANTKNETIGEVEQQGQQAMHQVLQVLRNAQSISSPGIGTTASTLVLTTYNPAATPTTFTVSGGMLTVCEGVGCTPVEITSGNTVISNLTFSNLSRPGTAGTVRVRFDLDSSSPSNRHEFHYPKTFYGTASLRQPE